MAGHIDARFKIIPAKLDKLGQHVNSAKRHI
ncbi:uncharacterized protein G2W53_003184 [Senna tora]|uniref:Uncharacterized protein n=1 Tax=Senna tora TaxID=362788 RepID=A0A835CGQ1_9FABA|nr:uncharacterized protein G2W53_003184 [Senna tora]